MRKILLILPILMLLCACIPAKATHEEEFAVIRSEQADLYTIRVVMDRVTGVEYIVVIRGSGISITPRYNDDGTLKNGRDE